MAEAPPTPPLQLRESVRKMRKRVVSVMRRNNSTKSGKSGSTSEEPRTGPSSQTPSKSGHTHDDSEHEHEHERGRQGGHDDEHAEGEDHHSLHSGSATSSLAPSLRHSASSRFGSRSGSPQPTATTPQPAVTQSNSNGHLAPPSNTHRFSMPHIGFPRSPTFKRSKSRQRDGPLSGSESPPAVRTRTVSTPTGPSLVMTSAAAAADLGMLTVPIPTRPRTLSHPLAASPIMPPSPSKAGDSRFPPASSPSKQQAAVQESAPAAAPAPIPAPAAISEVLDTVKQETTGTPTLPGPVSSPPITLVDSLTAVDVASPALTSDVIVSPPMLGVPSSPPVPEVVSAPAPDVFTAPTPAATPAVESEAREPLVGHARESSGGHAREHGSGLSRAASTIGSDLGWSMLEPTQEEEEPEEEVKAKEADALKAEAQKDKGKQVKVEEVPVKLGDSTPKIEELAAKVEDVPTEVEEASINTSESAVKVEKDDAALDDLVQNMLNKDFQKQNPVRSHANSEGRTPLDEGEVNDVEGSRLFDDREIVASPEPEGTEKDADSRQPSREVTSDLASSGVFVENPSTLPVPPQTPPQQTGKAFMSGRDSTFSTPDDPSPDSRFSGSDTPSRIAMTSTPSRLAGTDTPPRFSGTETPPRPGMGFSYGSYTGDQTPPPPPLHMSESFFHPRNAERLNPRHFERSMSTMGVYGDADPDGASVQERLLGEPLPLIDTVLETDTSVHNLVSPNVLGEQGVERSELRELSGTELKDWYEGPGRTPKSVRMLLPENEGEDGASGSGVPTRPRSALAQSETAEESQLQPPIQLQSPQPLTQEVVQPQSDRAQLYSSVLSRLITHMDRRSSLMSRLATRLGSLGNGLTAPERHPREWIAQVLPSGKIYYAHRILADDERITGNEVARAGTSNEVAKVLVIPTPSAPQPVTLVTDLDMSDNTTHAGVNAFVDKCLQERDTDLPNGWEVWVHASGEGERLLDTSSERWEEGSEGGESVDLGYGAPCVLVWSYVSHKRRRVGSQGPEDKFVTGEDAELDLEMERRYWAYVETHPAHADVNLRAVQEAIELLTWHYTDRLLAEKKPSGEKEYIHVKPPFTPEESHEVLEFLKSLSAEYSHSNAVLKTRTVARVHVRTAEWRLAKLHAVADAVNLQVMSPSERARRRRAAANPFIGVPLRTLAGLLGLGIPYLYVDQPDEKVEDRQRLMVADASTNLMSALMLGASVSFLAIPDLEDIARLAGVAAAACSLGSLAAGIVRLRMPFSRSGNADDASEEEPRPSALRTFARSLPLVLSAYAGSALVAGLAAYSWRGQVSSVDDPFTRLYLDDTWRSDSSGGRWLGGLVRRDGGSGNGVGGIGLEQGRQSWSEASSQGVVRLWGSW